MRILNCEFKVRNEMPGNELVGKGDEYRSPKYEIVSHIRNFLVVKIFASLAGGVRYRDGSADILDGFISIERFQSLTEEGKILSLSFWRDESAIEEWRNTIEHRTAQKKGKEFLFRSYRIRIAQVVRDYTETDRDEAPSDSKKALA